MEHEGGNGLIHRADPAQPGSSGTPRSFAFVGRKSAYFLEGLKKTLSVTPRGGGAGADHPQTNSSNRRPLLPSLPPSLYIYPPSASARCWRRPRRAARPTRALSHWACWGPLSGGWEPDPGHRIRESGCWCAGESERERQSMDVFHTNGASVSPQGNWTKPGSQVSLTIPSGIPQEPHQGGPRVLS